MLAALIIATVLDLGLGLLLGQRFRVRAAGRKQYRTHDAGRCLLRADYWVVFRCASGGIGSDP
jgi:hypothetical protein